jgi:hypothetical protein
MSNITNIAKIDGGWLYTLDTAPANGWDIWLAAVRLASRVTDTEYKVITGETVPPAIEVVDPYLETPSFGSAGRVRLQWQHVGALYYIVERSSDGVTYSRVGVVPGAGNVWHTFVFPGTNGRSYWKVYAAAEDQAGYYKTSYALPLMVDQSVLPVPPEVLASYAAGNVTISAMTAIREEVAVGNGEVPAVTYGGTFT